MKIFLSWSEERSKIFAGALKDWIPDILQGAQPWMSEQDITAGSRWQSELTTELEGQSFGILCVTPENQSNSWLVFEAGALSKSITQSSVVPLLIGMDKTDLKPPLSQFQAVRATNEGILKLLESMNSTLNPPLPPERLKRSFEKFWPDLEKTLASLEKLPEGTNAPTKRSDRELLEEILELTRHASKQQPIKSAFPFSSLVPNLVTFDFVGFPSLQNFSVIAEESEFVTEVFERIEVSIGINPAIKNAYGRHWALKSSDPSKPLSDTLLRAGTDGNVLEFLTLFEVGLRSPNKYLVTRLKPLIP